jgi:hypothetical protein
VDVEVSAGSGLWAPACLYRLDEGAETPHGDLEAIETEGADDDGDPWVVVQTEGSARDQVAGAAALVAVDAAIAASRSGGGATRRLHLKAGAVRADRSSFSSGGRAPPTEVVA